jgi:hypothetical protein
MGPESSYGKRWKRSAGRRQAFLELWGSQSGETGRALALNCSYDYSIRELVSVTGVNLPLYIITLVARSVCHSDESRLVNRDGTIPNVGIGNI